MVPQRGGLVAAGVIPALLLTVVGVQPAVAAAPTVAVRLVPTGLLYTATDPASHNTLIRATDTTVTLTEYGPTPIQQPLPKGCSAAASGDGGTAVTCALAGRKTVQVLYESGDDYLEADEALPQRLSLDVRTGEGVNAALGGLGADTFVGGGGGDTFYGGAGPDVVRAGDGFNFVHGNSGEDLLASADGSAFLFGDASNDVLVVDAGLYSYQFGGGGDDLLTGGSGADSMFGGSGNDLLTGRAGADELNGGSGADTLLGGPGDDLLRLRDGGTADRGSCGDGQDTARVDSGDVDRVDRTCETVVRYDPAVEDPEDENDIVDESFEEAVDKVDVHSGYPSGFHRALWQLFRHHG